MDREGKHSLWTSTNPSSTNDDSEESTLNSIEFAQQRDKQRDVASDRSDSRSKSVETVRLNPAVVKKKGLKLLREEDNNNTVLDLYGNLSTSGLSPVDDSDLRKNKDGLHIKEVSVQTAFCIVSIFRAKMDTLNRIFKCITARGCWRTSSLNQEILVGGHGAGTWIGSEQEKGTKCRQKKLLGGKWHCTCWMISIHPGLFYTVPLYRVYMGGFWDWHCWLHYGLWICMLHTFCGVAEMSFQVCNPFSLFLCTPRLSHFPLGAISIGDLVYYLTKSSWAMYTTFFFVNFTILLNFAYSVFMTSSNVYWMTGKSGQLLYDQLWNWIPLFQV